MEKVFFQQVNVGGFVYVCWDAKKHFFKEFMCVSRGKEKLRNCLNCRIISSKQLLRV